MNKHPNIEKELQFPVFSFSLKSHYSGLILVFDPYDTTPFVYLNLN